MPFELVHVRISKAKGEKKPVLILCSGSNYFQTECTEESGRTYLTNCSRNSDTPLFVVVFEDDRPHSAFAVNRGAWRTLELVKAPPLPADLSTLNLYSGNAKVSPLVVTRW
jgi:hypothetical protein